MKPGDLDFIVVGELLVPVIVVEVLPGGREFRVRLGSASARADHAPRLPTADELAAREDRIEADHG